MTRVGLLGGTFDPIHRGHLDVADAARTALGLTEIVLVPSCVPPHRRPPVAAAAHRFAMAVLAAQPFAHMRVSAIEMRDAIGQGAEDAPSYTAATLDRLAARGVVTTGLVFITGADAFREIGTWKDYPAILDRCHFAAVSRPGYPASALRRDLPGLAPRMVDGPVEPSGALPERPAILLVDAPTADVSSTLVRQRLQAGASAGDLLPPLVAEYIQKHGLYSRAPSKDFA